MHFSNEVFKEMKKNEGQNSKDEERTKWQKRQFLSGDDLALIIACRWMGSPRSVAERDLK